MGLNVNPTSVKMKIKKKKKHHKDNPASNHKNFISRLIFLFLHVLIKILLIFTSIIETHLNSDTAECRTYDAFYFKSKCLLLFFLFLQPQLEVVLA